MGVWYESIFRSFAVLCLSVRCLFSPLILLENSSKGGGKFSLRGSSFSAEIFLFYFGMLIYLKNNTHTQMFLLLVHSPNDCRSGPGQNHQPRASSVLPRGHRGQGLGCFPRHICREAGWEVEQWQPIPPLHHRANLWNLVGHFLFPISSVLPVLISSLLF